MTAKRLVEVHNGEHMLNFMGTMYKLVSHRVTGILTEQVNTKMGRIDALHSVQEANTGMAAADEGEEGSDEILPAVAEMHGEMMEAAFYDIMTTLCEVLLKVLLDYSVSKAIRKKRATAVCKLDVLWEGQKREAEDGMHRRVRDLFVPGPPLWR